MNYKLSDYNIGFVSEEKDILFNTRYNNYTIVEKKLSGKIRDGVIPPLMPGEVKHLKERGFLVSTDANEQHEVYVDFMTRKHAPDNLDISVAITYKCNFSCMECYQKDYQQDTDFSEGNIGALEAFVDFIVKIRNPIKCTLWIYGGEPLLFPEKCRKIIINVKKVCEKHHKSLEVFITTNGSLISSEKCRVLIPLIDHYYISIMESRESQKKMRSYKNQTDSYDDSLSGLALLADHCRNITLRVNIHNTGQLACDLEKTFANVYKAFNGKAYAKIKFAFAFLNTYTQKACGFSGEEKNNQLNLTDEIYDTINRIFEKTQWSKQHFHFLRKTRASKLFSIYTGIGHLETCDYIKGSRFFIKPNGDFSFCHILEDNNNYVFGNIQRFDGILRNRLYLKAVNTSVFDIPQCRNCEYLPLCLNKCTLSFLRNDPSGSVSSACQAGKKMQIARYLSGQLKIKIPEYTNV